MSQPSGVESHAFPKDERIRKRAAYLAVQGCGRKLQTAHFLCFAKASVDGRRRIGITVSKRVGNAVVRNRIKRLVREAYRLAKQSFPEGIDLVVVAKQRASGVELEEVRQEMAELCGRLGRSR